MSNSISDSLSLRFSKIVSTWLATLEPQIGNSKPLLGLKSKILPNFACFPYIWHWNGQKLSIDSENSNYEPHFRKIDSNSSLNLKIGLLIKMGMAIFTGHIKSNKCWSLSKKSLRLVQFTSKILQNFLTGWIWIWIVKLNKGSNRISPHCTSGKSVVKLISTIKNVIDAPLCLRACVIGHFFWIKTLFP